MVLVKILGGIDALVAVVFLCEIFGIQPWLRIILFCAGLLLLKGFIGLPTGDILGLIDIFSSIILLLSIFFAMPTVLLWIPTFLLLAKGLVSFL